MTAATAATPVRFCGIRKVYGESEVDSVGGKLPCDARVWCQRGAAPRSGRYCQDCRRLLAWDPGPADGEVILSCVWTHADPVSARMTGRSALVAVPPSLRCRDAAELARRHRLRHLLVVDAGQLAGIICRRDLERHPDDCVAERMERDVYIIPSVATLGQAAAAMARLGIGCLPVLRDDRLVGILTRGDLVRSGLPRRAFAR